MSAIAIGTWLARARGHWQHSVPHCGEPGCNLTRRLWRRVRWWNGAIRLHGFRYCAPQCFESAVRERLTRASTAGAPARSVHHRVPLGLLMLSRGQLTNRQLRSALDAQQESGRYRLGEWLEKLGFATENQVTTALGLQWACPVLTARANRDPNCAHLLPHRLLEAYHMLPLQFVEATRTLYLAFCDGIDYRALHSIEQMLNCHTDACLVTRSTMEQALEQITRERRPGDYLFEGWRDVPEIARITCSYVLKLGAEDVRVVSCGGHVWVRLAVGKDSANLLFRRPAVEREASGSDDRTLSRRVAG
ncbi:MAG: hypothetical protein LAO09_14455 [Acidobacteriia bacterium]|nr:hypothetical protein [Terriglobia bacterium]